MRNAKWDLENEARLNLMSQMKSVYGCGHGEFRGIRPLDAVDKLAETYRKLRPFLRLWPACDFDGQTVPMIDLPNQTACIEDFKAERPLRFVLRRFASVRERETAIAVGAAHNINDSMIIGWYVVWAPANDDLPEPTFEQFGRAYKK